MLKLLELVQQLAAAVVHRTEPRRGRQVAHVLLHRQRAGQQPPGQRLRVGQALQVDAAVARARGRVPTNSVVARLGAGAASSEWLKSRNKLFKAMDVSEPRVQVCEGGVCKEELDMKDMDAALREVR